MLKLIRCEFWKLKRKKLLLFVAFMALIFPIPFVVLVMKGNVGNLNAFEALYQMLLCMEIPVMLPSILGILASMLFFMERENGTMKNIRAIPVPGWRLATAKIAVLFLLGILYGLGTWLSSLAGGLLAGGELGNLLEKAGLSVITSVFYTAGVLPAVTLVVGLNRSYIFSILFTLFYTVFGFLLGFTGSFTSGEPVLRTLTNLLPMPVIYRWQAAWMVEEGTKAYGIWKPYMLPFGLTALTIFLLGGISYLAIIGIYRKREESIC